MHIPPPRADTTTTITVSVCPKCGTIAKSGKMSCCGRGGSWFKTCGGVGNTKLQHTWHEGIQACKTPSQSKKVIRHQLNGAQQKGIDSSQGAGMENYKSVISTTKTFPYTSTPTSDTTTIVTSTYTSASVSITTSAHMLMTNPSNNILMTSPTHTSASVSILTQGCVNLLKITTHSNLLFIIVFIFY